MNTQWLEQDCVAKSNQDYGQKEERVSLDVNFSSHQNWSLADRDSIDSKRTITQLSEET